MPQRGATAKAGGAGALPPYTGGPTGEDWKVLALGRGSFASPPPPVVRSHVPGVWDFGRGALCLEHDRCQSRCVSVTTSRGLSASEACLRSYVRPCDSSP